MDCAELERLDWEGLVLRAQAAGIRRARVLTRPELVDELLRLDPTTDARQLKRTRGFFGLARDLLSRVVERGLHLPDAADRLRAALGDPLPEVPRPEPQAIPTVTLAEIYAAQGHKQRAIDTLRRVLEIEPDHGAARALLEKLEDASYVAPPPPALPPEDEPLRAEIPDPPPTPEPITSRYPEEETILAEPPSADHCIAIPIHGTDASYVWWRLSLDRRSEVSGELLVRAVVIVPSWDGPRSETRDLLVDPAAGELILRDLPANAVVRVAIGRLEGGELVPFAHSPAIEAADGALVHWTLEGRHPVVFDDADAAPIAEAAERAARLGQARTSRQSS